CVAESVVRAPVFLFENIKESIEFLNWILPLEDKFKELASQTTRFGKLIDLKATINNSNVYITFEYSTGDAAGQNMVTIATDHICHYIIENTPVKPTKWFLDGNLSGDKKATMLSFLGNRGKKVIAECIIPRRVVQRFLHTDPEMMVEFGMVTQQGAAQSGGIGVQGHYANALAAIYMACGQDAACVSESSIGISTMKLTSDGDLYVSVSLPNLIVGTVGGGTHLPTAKECLELVECYGPGKAKKFAEICAATVLAGEISIVGAFAAGHFARAHSTHRHKL
ncbi:MAG: hydroxymethylglutaryl-CoA reductase, partial [Lentisphaeria bacterium]